MADRLSIGTQYEKMIEEIDSVDMLNLKTNGGRADIFIIAMALGVNKGIRTQSKAKHGFILETSAKNKDSFMSFIYSVAVDELRKNGQENQIVDNNVVYNIAEEYANTGFEIMKEMVTDFSKYDEEDFEFELIEMMDEIIQQ